MLAAALTGSFNTQQMSGCGFELGRPTSMRAKISAKDRPSDSYQDFTYAWLGMGMGCMEAYGGLFLPHSQLSVLSGCAHFGKNSRSS